MKIKILINYRHQSHKWHWRLLGVMKNWVDDDFQLIKFLYFNESQQLIPHVTNWASVLVSARESSPRDSIGYREQRRIVRSLFFASLSLVLWNTKKSFETDESYDTHTKVTKHRMMFYRYDACALTERRDSVGKSNNEFNEVEKCWKRQKALCKIMQSLSKCINSLRQFHTRLFSKQANCNSEMSDWLRKAIKY